MRILVTFAIDAEFAPWKSRHLFVPYEFDESGKRRDFDLFRANIGVSEVSVLLTGMGAENARNAVKSVSLERPDVLISTGLAGALDAGLRPGDIVAARTAERIDRTIKTESDAALLALAAHAGASVVSVFLTSETVVATAREKESLSGLGSVVEMESAYILEEAAPWQCPVVAVRSISDVADEDLPVDFERIADSRGHVKIGGLLKELALHPHRLPLLVRFGQQSRAAAEALADFLDQYISLLAQKWPPARTTQREEISAT